MELKVNKSFGWNGQLSESAKGCLTAKAGLVCRMFGMTIDGLRQREIKCSCQLELREGDIVYITGPSGSGKSVILNEIERQLPQSEKINLSQIELTCERSVIDCIGGGVIDSLKVLNTAGLNDVHCILNRPAFLSDGQKQRFRLAMALSAGKKYIIADEFCSQLDRVTAAVIAYNIRRFASKYKAVFLLASCQDDILADLQPDVLVVKDLCGGTDVIYKEVARQYE